MNCKEKQIKLIQAFQACSNSRESIYHKIIELGQTLPLFKEEWKREENLVRGCQSSLYLRTNQKGTVLKFTASSDALISAGLAALLIRVYDGEEAEVIVRNPPNFLEEIGIPKALSPSRSNGLASLYTRMKQEALNTLITIRQRKDEDQSSKSTPDHRPPHT